MFNSSGMNSKLFTALILVFLWILPNKVNAGSVPSFSSVFAPDTIGPGSSTQLKFTISNAGMATPVSNLNFMNNLPAGVFIVDKPKTNCYQAIVTAPFGGSTITFVEGQLAAGASCTIRVNVTSSAMPTPGNPIIHTNVSGNLTSSAGNSGTATDDLTVVAERPGFSKSFSPSTISVGQTSTLTFTVANTANPSGVANLNFSDNLPTGMVISNIPNVTNNCGNAQFPASITANPGTQLISLFANGFLPNFPALDAGAVCTLSVDVITNSGGNFANVSNNLIAGVQDSGFAVAELRIPINTLSKSFVDDPTVPGGLVTLDFTITNFSRNDALTNLTFTDDLNSVVPGLLLNSVISNDCGGSVTGVGTSDINFSGGIVAAQGTCTISTELSVATTVPSGNYLNSTSAITGIIGGTNFIGNVATDTLSVQASPLVTKTFTNDPVNPGDSVVLEFTVTNTSTTSSATDISFEDILSTVINTASVTPGNNCLGTGSICTFTPLFNPPGSDAIPARISISGGILAPAGMAGDSATFSFTLDVVSDASTGTYPNETSMISATVDGFTRFGKTAKDDLVVIAAPSLTKEFTDDPVAPGGTVTLEFTLEHSEEAPSDATGITFTDDLEATLTGLTAIGLPLNDVCGAGSSFTGTSVLTLTNGNLAKGENCTFSVTLNVPALAAPGSYTNVTSNVSATVSGQPTVSNVANDDLNVSGLTFSKEFIDDPVIPGDTVTLRFTIENIHPTEDATITLFTDDLAAELSGLSATGPVSVDTCGGTLTGTTFLVYTGGSVLVGNTCTIEVEVLVPLAAADGDYINVTSNLSADQGGAVVVDPAVDVLVVDSTLIQLTKQFTNDPVAAGEQVTLEFTLTNLDATRAASAIGFTDDLGATLSGLTFDSIPSNNCGATVSGTGTSLVTVTGGSLAAAGSCTIELSLTVPVSATVGVYVNTTSDVSGTINGLAVTGASATDELEILDSLLFNKIFLSNSTATGTPTLRFSILNPGSLTVNSVAFNDDLDAVLSGLVATSLPLNDACGTGSVLSGTSLLTLTGANLGSMQNCVFDVPLLVPSTAVVGIYTNITSDLTSSGLKVSDPASANLVIEPPPVFAKGFSPFSIGVGQTSTLLFSIDNSFSALAANNLDFTDNLPAGMVVATPANASTTCNGGTLTATSGAGVISYTGGSVTASAVCTVQVDVQANATGALVNTSGDLTSSSGNSGLALDTLTVNPQPVFSKSFAPSSTILGGVSTLTFTIDNSLSTVATTALDFSDTFPAGMLVASIPNASTTCTGGTLTAAAGSGSISYTTGSIASTSSCIIQVDVVGNMVGSLDNVSSQLNSSLGLSGAASDTLVVNPAPAFSKQFLNSTISTVVGTQLVFTIDNTASTVAATGLDFTDNMPVAVIVDTAANVINTCGSGTVTATPGTSTISYTGGTVAAGSSCFIYVSIASSTPGEHVNVTGDLTSSSGNSGVATDTIMVSSLPVFSKAFMDNPSTINAVNQLSFTIDNSAGLLDILSISFDDNLPAGMEVASPANPVDNCSGSIITTLNSIQYSGGSVLSGNSCTITVDVIAVTFGTFNNSTTALATNWGFSNVATDSLVIEPAPLFNKAFVQSGYTILPGAGQATPPFPFVIGINGTSSLVFTIDNTANTLDATNLDFVDNLPADLILATPVNAQTNCTAGSLTANDGGTSISYTGGSVAAGELCVIVVDVTSSVLGTYNNVSNPLTSSHGDSGSASHSIIVGNRAIVSKSFARSVDIINTPNTLTFTFDNSAAMVNNLVSLVDPLPSGMQIASTPNLITDCAPFFSITAPPSGTTISLIETNLLAGATCLLSIDIIATSSGTLVNITDPLSSDLGLSNQATATLTVEQPPVFTKSFAPATIGPGGVSTLTLSIDNSSNTIDATALDFTDNLPTGVTLATPANASTTCTGGTLTAVDGSSVVSYLGGTVTNGTMCTISADVTSSTIGSVTNLTGDLTSSHGNSGTASASLVVGNAPILSKAFFDDPTLLGVNNPLGFTIDNSMNAVDVSALAFTDPLPAGLEIANPAGILIDCIGGVLTAVPGTQDIIYSGGTVLASSTCGISVNVVATNSGTFNNITSLLSTSLGDSNSATDDLTVDAEPIVMKTFTPSTIGVNGISRLDIIVDNTLGAIDVTALVVNDDFPADMLLASPNNASTTCVGGTLTAVDAGVGFNYDNGTVPSGTSCSVSVDVTSSVSGTYVNTTNDIISGHGNSGTATAELTVEAGMSLTKSFTTPSIIAGENAEMILTLTNNSSVTANQINFTDDLDAFITGAEGFGLPLNNVCGAGSSVTGGSTITINNATLAPNSSCQFSVFINVPISTMAGSYVNITSPVSVDYNGTIFIGPAGSGAAGSIIINGVTQIIPVFSHWIITVLMVLMLMGMAWFQIHRKGIRIN